MSLPLLLDENLSERLLILLEAQFPGSAHVRQLGLAGAADTVLWQVAGERGLTLLTRDQDFVTLSVMRASPPKVIWLNVGNAATVRIGSLILEAFDTIDRFLADADATVLALGFLKPTDGAP